MLIPSRSGRLCEDKLVDEVRHACLAEVPQLGPQERGS